MLLELSNIDAGQANYWFQSVPLRLCYSEMAQPLKPDGEAIPMRFLRPPRRVAIQETNDSDVAINKKVNSPFMALKI